MLLPAQRRDSVGVANLHAGGQVVGGQLHSPECERSQRVRGLHRREVPRRRRAAGV